MFEAIEKKDIRRLKKLGQHFHAKNKETAALLCLDHAFSVSDNLEKSIEMSDIETAISSSQIFLTYAELMYECFAYPPPLNSKSVSRLFCVKEATSQQRLLLTPGTFLHKHMRLSPVGEVSISYEEFLDLFNKSLSSRLYKSINAQLNLFLQCKVFDPCPSLATSQPCQKRDCLQKHVLDLSWFNARIRFQLLQVSIVQFLHLRLKLTVIKNDPALARIER